MKIDIIIPNFNGAYLIEKNLQSVLTAHQGYAGKIIIIDDGSGDEDRQNLRRIIKLYDKDSIVLIEHEHNQGFSSAVNTGAFSSQADYIVLLNSDVVPSKNFLASPINYLNNDENLFAVGCMDKSIENGKMVLRGRGLAKWTKGFIQHSRGEVGSKDTFWVSGGSSVMRRIIYEKLGGMDEIYNPFYWEDIDLSYRAQKSGYKLIFDNKSIVSHYHDKGAIKSNFTSAHVTTTAYRNQFIFIWKNISSLHLLINHLLYLPVHFFGAIKRKDSEFIKGLFLAIVLLPAIMNKRKKQKIYYKVSDLEIIKQIS